METRRPTVRDVAEAAGVSRATVSRVLNGGHWVSTGARSAVEDAIRSLGFRANPHARSLVTRRSRTVAFLLTEPHRLLFDDPNFAILLRLLAEGSEQRGLTLVLMFAGSDLERDRAREFITSGHVDGVFLVSHHTGNPLVSELVEAEIPIVTVGAADGFEQWVSSVAADDRGGAVVATRHLVSAGRRRIATIAGPVDTSGGVDRLSGYRIALGDGFDPARVAYGDWSGASGAAAMRTLLDRDGAIDGVFVANDAMAVAAIEEIRSHGRRVPDEIAVIGFDDTPLAADADPPLTTVRQPFPRIANEMVRLLSERLAGGPPAGIRLPTELVIRQSA